MRDYLISPPDRPPFVVSGLIHPCDDPPPYEAIPAVIDQDGKEVRPALIIDPGPFYTGPREDVIDVEADPDNPAWLRYRGLISDETYDRLKAEGLIDLVDGRVAVLDRINEPGAVQK